MDTEALDRLIEILNKETDIYEGILKLSKNKTDVIVEGKVSELEGVTKLEQGMIVKLGKLEDERETLVAKLAEQANVKVSEITLANLIKMAPKAQANKLKECSRELPDVIKKLSEANSLNSKLIRSSLDYIDFSVNVLTAASSPDSTYGNEGQSKEPKNKNFFDMKL